MENSGVRVADKRKENSMSSTRKFGQLLIGCVVVLALCTSTSGVASAKGPQPKATASPNTNLTNGETVTVTGSHFLPNSQVFLVTCAKGTKGKSGLAGEPYCDTFYYVATVTTSTGSLPPGLTFMVSTGFSTASGTTCGTTKKNKVCYIGIGNSAGSNDDDALAKITFAVPT